MGAVPLQVLDVTNGSIEYDVHQGLPGSQNVTNLTIALDARCPQIQEYGVLRCTAHLHIGG